MAAEGSRGHQLAASCRPAESITAVPVPSHNHLQEVLNNLYSRLKGFKSIPRLIEYLLLSSFPDSTLC